MPNRCGAAQLVERVCPPAYGSRWRQGSPNHPTARGCPVGERNTLEYVPHKRGTWPSMGLPRRVRVKGMAGVDATVVVTVVHDTVWLSISPPFTYEAIMKAEQVDEVISILELARDEAEKR